MTGKAHVIGVTGSPGAGKSTLVDQLAKNLRAQGQRVAILAIDPSSPFSGGAVLGDRIRMVAVQEDPDVFIRSMATRGALGGISRATYDAVQVLDAAGFDSIIIETVGVGQGEVDIVRLSDTCLVVLVPGMGDSVQAIKAGILEIADVFVINKADREGADILQKDLRVLLTLSEYPEGAWTPPITRTVATTGEGAAEVVSECAKHRAWLESSGHGRERRTALMRETIVRLALDTFAVRVADKFGPQLDGWANECLERKRDPFTVAEKMLET